MAIFEKRYTNKVLLDDTEQLTSVIENARTIDGHTVVSSLSTFLSFRSLSRFPPPLFLPVSFALAVSVSLSCLPAITLICLPRLIKAHRARWSPMGDCSYISR